MVMETKECDCCEKNNWNACGKCVIKELPQYWCETCGKQLPEKRCPDCGLKSRKMSRSGGK